MKILFIFDGDYPWDIRVQKMCNSLCRVGHSVSLICRNEKKRDVREKQNKFLIHRMPVFPSKLNYILTFPIFINPLWIIRVFLYAIRWADVIIVRDLPLAPLAVFVGKITKVPVVYDMAEPYPEGLRSNWAYDKMKFLDYFTRNPFFAELLEKVVLRYVDGLWVVSEESDQRAKQIGCREKIVSIVGNSPALTTLEKNLKKTYPGKMAHLKERFILIFVGYLLGDRGLDFAIKCMKKITSVNKSFALLIVGSGPRERELKELTEELKLTNDVFFEGWVDNSKIPEYLASANVGILPFKDCTHINITLANKLFDYMAMSLPVLASAVKPMKRIIEETGAGITFKPEDIKDFVAKALEVETERVKLLDYGTKGRAAVEEKYSWDHEEQRIFASIKNIQA